MHEKNIIQHMYTLFFSQISNNSNAHDNKINKLNKIICRNKLKQILKKMKLETLFPVQKQVIPVILNQSKSQPIYPNDLCILAPTGSGKTLTYVLPILKRLRSRLKPCVRAVILTPVSDLAEQVYSVFKTYMNDQASLDLIDSHSNNNSNQIRSNLRIALLTNKNAFSKEQQNLISEEHGHCLYDIIVATPGRLVDHIQKTNCFDMSQLSFLVLDECDRMIEGSFFCFFVGGFSLVLINQPDLLIL